MPCLPSNIDTARAAPFWDRYAAMRFHFGTIVRFHWGTNICAMRRKSSRLQNGQDQRNHTKTQGTPTSYRHIWTGCRACQAILILHMQLHFGTTMPLCDFFHFGTTVRFHWGTNICAMRRKSSGYKMVRTKEITRKHKAHSTSYMGTSRTGCRACQAILILYLQLHFATAMPLCASHFRTTVRFHWGTSMRDLLSEISRLQNGQDQRNYTKTQGTLRSYRHIWTGCRKGPARQY